MCQNSCFFHIPRVGNRRRAWPGAFYISRVGNQRCAWPGSAAESAAGSALDDFWGGALSHPTCWGSTPGCVRPGGAFAFRISMVLRRVLWTRCFWLRPSAACPAWRSGCSSTGPRSLRCVPRALRFKSSEGLCGVQIRCRAVRPVLTLGRFFCPRPRRTAFWHLFGRMLSRCGGGVCAAR